MLRTLSCSHSLRTKLARRGFPIAITLLLLIGGGTTSTVESQSAPTARTSSLYKQLGGYDGVHEFVALVFPRVAQHPELRRMFQGHGADSQQKQFQHVVELICHRTGGPCAYTGREMRTVHVGLGITPADWDVFMKIIDDGLDEKNYAPTVRAAFRELWASFRGGVVEPK